MWDKSKEKSYRTIFFVECEDGRVGISYFNFKTFTTKNAVQSLPFPVPYMYGPLSKFGGNRRAAIRLYREYLFNEAHNAEVQDAIKRDEEREEQDAAEKREEVLRREAEVNKTRWETKKEKKGEMPQKTKELRKTVLGIGASEKNDRGKLTQKKEFSDKVVPPDRQYNEGNSC